jgi:hypothetical protein
MISRYLSIVSRRYVVIFSGSGVLWVARDIEERRRREMIGELPCIL